jgi:hypothetical protein
MKKILTISLLLLLNSCAHYIDPTFDPYLKDIVKLCNDYHGDKCEWIERLTFEFDKLDDNTGAVCTINGIYVNINAWNSHTELGKQEMLLHEIGHCLYSYVDIREIDPKIGYPDTIMYYSLDRTVHFYEHEEYRDEMLKNFFSGKN